jgi:hypothetical protein
MENGTERAASRLLPEPPLSVTEEEEFRALLGARTGRYITTYLEERAMDGKTLPFLPVRLLSMKDPYMGMSIFALTVFHRILYKLAIDALTANAVDTAQTIEGIDLMTRLKSAQGQVETHLPEIIEAMLEEAGVPPRRRPADTPATSIIH